jgi:hypothetical protein
MPPSHAAVHAADHVAIPARFQPPSPRARRPGPGVTIRPYLQLFAHLTGDSFRILPKRLRFPTAVRIARLIAPLLHRSRYYQRRPSLLDGPREEALRVVLRTMTRARVEYRPEVRFQGRELVPDGPVMILSGHFLLNVLTTRWIADAGRRLTAGLGGPREPMYYAGTTVPLDIAYAGSQMFVQMRRKIAAGDVLFLTIEVPVPHPEWLAVDTAAGRRYVSPATFAFAERTGTPVVFLATYLDADGHPQGVYERPRSTDAEAMAAEFCEFLRRHVGAVGR